MPRNLLTAGAVLCAALVLPGAAYRGVSFEQRVAAQRALDRLRHSHQEGTKTPFEQGVPRALSERRVRTQLQESVALEQFWKTSITPAMLQREMERIARSTLFPDRLLQIYAALDHDPVLVQEALARPAVVERLTRGFFASDERIHGEARAQAERLRERLLREKSLEPLDPGGEASLRIVELVREEGTKAPGAGTGIPAAQDAAGSRARADRHHADSGTAVLALAAVEYDAERSLAPSRVGEIGAIEEERDAFTIRRLLSGDETSARIAVYAVPKISWQTWWNAQQAGFPESAAQPVARGAGRLPQPPAAGGGARRPGRGDPPTEVPPAVECPPDDTWDTQPFEVLPRAMTGHQAVWTGREMIVWGGRATGGLRYDPLIDSWRGMSSIGAPEKGTAVWADRQMIVWDGQARNGARYDPVTDIWTSMATMDAPSAREDYPVVWTGTEMIIWGGYHFPFGFMNSGARYDLASDRWTPIANRDLPPPRSRHLAAWTGTEMIIWGGYSGWPALNEGARYDPAADRWTPISTAGAPSAGAAHAVWIGKELIVLGGGDWSTRVSARYDPGADRWSPLTGGFGSWLAGFVPLAWTGKEIIFWGNKAGAYDPDSGAWRYISKVNSSQGGTAVWTGNHVIAWGGGKSTGARYDPVSDAWTPTASHGGPSRGRERHEAVWTGNEMFILGSRGPVSAFDPLTSQWRTLPHQPAYFYPRGIWTGEMLVLYNGATGARYVPQSDAWLPMSQENLPRRHHGYSLVWTGREILLFGGHLDDEYGDGQEYFDSVSRYDPAADKWSETPVDWLAAGSAWGPPPRDGHAAVWTGTEMIIWGGSREYWYVEDLPGGRFNPETGRWRRVNEKGGPRQEQEAIWTGREMIVWRHESSGAPPARYDPHSDSWISLTDRGAPPVWYGESVTWTGNILVIWGGFSSETRGLVNTGARYDPALEAWTPMSTLNAPEPRRGHSAVWTGRGLIVWGGFVEAPLQTVSSDGGVYTFSVDRDRDRWTTCAGDCDDRDDRVHPGAADLPGNAADEDCDGALACDPSAAWSSPDMFVRCVARQCAHEARLGTIRREQCAALIDRAKDPLSCGDRIIGPGERCDGAVVTETCEDLGFDGGTLYCNADCDGYNLTACTTNCGDGRRRGFETCDLADLGGATCASLGFDGGSLACHDSCGAFDHSGCTSVCGDGVMAGREACDGADFGGRTCTSFGFDHGALACSDECDRVDTSACTSVCGDGLRRGMEICDGADLGEETCLTRGFDSGSLGCNETCDALDVTRCYECGDGVRQETEICDTNDHGGEACATQGFEAGELVCNGGCSGFETWYCMGCGNESVELDEECDGWYSGPDSCRARGFNFGWLECDDECRLDDSGCTHCGNGTRESSESCDGADLEGKSCTSLGYDGGSLACHPGCWFDTSGCAFTCGDGIAKGSETCDGSDLRQHQCVYLGFDGGTLGCNATCSAFDTSACIDSVCGDGVVNGFEECDGSVPEESTCESLGFAGGTLTCLPWCELDTFSCIQCGNGVREADELCDNEDVGAATCEVLGYPPGGTLRCNDTCDGYWTYHCMGCGDGEWDHGEVCDGTSFSRGETCASVGFLGGTLGCNATCDGLDTSGCSSICGDGLKHRPEECDRGDFGNTTCDSLGFSGGLLACGSDCRLDRSSCTVCGNGVVDGREECEGADLNGQTCATLGLGEGPLLCDATCHLYTWGCHVCGDSFVELPELCDGPVVGTTTCRAFGFDGGTLMCGADCASYDVSGCTTCGNGVREPGEPCDGVDLNGQTCGSQTGGTGTLACRADCIDFDITGCQSP